MTFFKSKDWSLFLSLLCAIAVFFMNGSFQKMAYWGDDLTWYWVGVVLTSLIWLVGLFFLAYSLLKRKQSLTLLRLILSNLSGILLLLGLVWTIFVISLGISGL